MTTTTRAATTTLASFTLLYFVHCPRCRGPLGFVRRKPRGYRPPTLAGLTTDPDCAVARLLRQLGVQAFTVIEDGGPPVRIYPGPAVEVGVGAPDWESGLGECVAVMLGQHECTGVGLYGEPPGES